MEVKGDFQESLEELGVHAGNGAQGAEGVQRRSARRRASARATSLRMTATGSRVAAGGLGASSLGSATVCDASVPASDSTGREHP